MERCLRNALKAGAQVGRTSARAEVTASGAGRLCDEQSFVRSAALGCIKMPSGAGKTEIQVEILVNLPESPEQVLMVGDALTDWEGAQGVGTKFIGVQSGKNANIFPSTKILLNNFSELDKCVYQN